MTTPANFARLGELLHGERWVHRLARDLQVDERTIRRWAAGEREIRPGVWRDLADVLRRQGATLTDEAFALERTISEA